MIMFRLFPLAYVDMIVNDTLIKINILIFSRKRTRKKKNEKQRSNSA